MICVTEALGRRISTRQFLPAMLPEALVREILDVARRAPSGGNLQPWRVIAVAGAERDALVGLAQRTLAARHAAGDAGSHDEGRPIYPASLWEPYRTRRFELGEDLYALLGIARADRAGRLAQFARNYEFFGAPVALFFAIDRRMGHGQWAHLGMFMQSVALAATERGVDSCMLESWAVLRTELHAHFALPSEQMIYCAMALGRADPDAAVNRLRSRREPVDSFATFRGFGGA
jgi:nitroreductase